MDKSLITAAPSAQHIFMTASDVALLADASSTRHLSKDEEYRLIKLWQEHGVANARARLLSAHENYCRKLAMQKHRSAQHVDIEDVYQEARIGIMIAIDKFNFDYDIRLATYASWWVKQRINDFITVNRAVQSRGINLTPAKRELLKQYNELIDGYHAENEGSPMTFAQERELQEKLGMPISEVKGLISSYYSLSTSLDAPIGNDDNARNSLIDTLIDGGENPLDALLSGEDSKYLHALLEQTDLKERERDIIGLRYLHPDGEMRTLNDIAEVYGITRERIRQIEVMALGKILKTAEETNPDALFDFLPVTKATPETPAIKPAKRKTVELDRAIYLNRINGVPTADQGFFSPFLGKYFAWAEQNAEIVAIENKTADLQGVLVPPTLLANLKLSVPNQIVDLVELKSLITSGEAGFTNVIDSFGVELGVYVPQHVAQEIIPTFYPSKALAQAADVGTKEKPKKGKTKEQTDAVVPVDLPPATYALAHEYLTGQSGKMQSHMPKYLREVNDKQAPMVLMARHNTPLLILVPEAFAEQIADFYNLKRDEINVSKLSAKPKALRDKLLADTSIAFVRHRDFSEKWGILPPNFMDKVFDAETLAAIPVGRQSTSRPQEYREKAFEVTEENGRHSVNTGVLAQNYHDAVAWVQNNNKPLHIYQYKETSGALIPVEMGEKLVNQHVQGVANFFSSNLGNKFKSIRDSAEYGDVAFLSHSGQNVAAYASIAQLKLLEEDNKPSAVTAFNILNAGNDRYIREKVQTAIRTAIEYEQTVTVTMQTANVSIITDSNKIEALIKQGALGAVETLGSLAKLSATFIQASDNSNIVFEHNERRIAFIGNPETRLQLA